MLPLYPNTTIVAFHGPFSGLYTSGLDSVISHFPNSEATGFPDGLGYFVPYPAITDTVGNLYERTPETPVAIKINTKNWNPDTRVVDLTFTMRNDGPDLEGTYGYNIIITEDNIMSPHQTHPGCSTPDTIQGYHWEYFNFWAARKMVTLPNGDSLVGPSWFGQLAITRSYSFSIDTAWVPQNCNIVVNVFKKADSLYKSPVLQVIKESITTASTIGDENTVDQGIIGIFPNPTKDKTNLHFSLSSATFCSLNIYDLKGNKMKNIIHGYVKPGLYNVEIEADAFPKGTYLVVLETNDPKYSRQTRKIIKL